MPALAKVWSIRPWAVFAALNRAVRSLQDVTFVFWKSRLGCWRGGSLRSPATTRAPVERRSCTVASPMPEDPPVYLR